MDGENPISPIILLMLFLNSLFLGTALSDNNNENFDLKGVDVPKLDFGKYYFESSKSGNTIILLSNVKPQNIKVFCLNQTGIYEIDLIFYQNIVGYKAEFKGNCDKIKVYSNEELVYYKDFSFE